MSFTRQLNLATKEVLDITERDWRRSVNEAFLSTILKTPVDKGQAINSWHTNLNGTNGGEGARGSDRSGGESIKDMQTAVGRSELGGRVLLYSNLPYIKRLEDGYSLQAPAGMVKTTEAEWPQIVARNSRG